MCLDRQPSRSTGVGCERRQLMFTLVFMAYLLDFKFQLLGDASAGMYEAYPLAAALLHTHTHP